MIKITLWDEIAAEGRRYEALQLRRLACDEVRRHIAISINALRIEAHSLPIGTRKAQLLTQIADLYDLFCELG